MVTGCTDRSKHRAVGGSPILQQDDLVAHDQRTTDDGLFQGNLLVENIDVAGLGFQIGDDSSVLLRREWSARILEPGCLPGVLIDQGIGIGERSATCRENQASRRYGNQSMDACKHISPEPKKGTPCPFRYVEGTWPCRPDRQLRRNSKF
jgi:hypothetical protein